MRVVRFLLQQPEVQSFLGRFDTGPAPVPVADTAHEELLSVDEVADILKCSHSRVYELLRQGKIPQMWMGRRVRVPKGQLMAWIRSGGDKWVREEAEKHLARTPQVRQPVAKPVEKARQTTPEPAKEPSKPLTITQAAKKLKIGEMLLRNLVRDNKVPYYRVGTKPHFNDAELDEYISRQGVAPEEGWEAWRLKRNFALLPADQKRDMLDMGFDPETGTFR